MTPRQQSFHALSIRPASIGCEEVGWLLGIAKHSVGILVRRGVLKPLGRPAKNSEKRFYTREIEEFSQDKKSMDLVVRTLQQHWKDRGNKQSEI